jgi:hypothetical protein
MAHHESFVKAIAEILVKQGSLPQKEVAPIIREFRASEKERFDQFLIDEGLVDEAAMLRALSTYYKVPSFEVPSHLFKHELLRMFPKEIMTAYAFIPLEVGDDESIMTVVAADPKNEELLPIIGKSVSYDIRFLVGHYVEIQDAIEEFYDKALTQVRSSMFSEDDEDFDLDDERDVIIYEDTDDQDSSDDQDDE